MSPISSTKAIVYRDRAESFLKSMRLLLEWGDPTHGSAIGLLAVHSAISLADAALVYHTGAHSKDDHAAAAGALKTLAEQLRISHDSIGSFKRLLGMKHLFAYNDRVPHPDKHVKTAVLHAEKFADWIYGNVKSLARPVGDKS